MGTYFLFKLGFILQNVLINFKKQFYSDYPVHLGLLNIINLSCNLKILDDILHDAIYPTQCDISYSKLHSIITMVIKNNKNPGNFKFSCSNKIKTHALIFYVSSSCCYDFLHTIWHGIH